jgi:hypothetical protein
LKVFILERRLRTRGRDERVSTKRKNRGERKLGDHSQLGLLKPGRLSVVEVPLIAKGDDALVGATTHDEVLRLRVGEGEIPGDHVLPNLGLGVLNLASLEGTDDHGSLVETLLVGELLGLGELLDVLGGLNPELLHEGLGGKVAVGRGGEDGDGLKSNPGGIDAVVLGLLLEIERGDVVVG